MPDKVRPEKVRPDTSGDATDASGEPIDAPAGEHTSTVDATRPATTGGATAATKTSRTRDGSATGTAARRTTKVTSNDEKPAKADPVAKAPVKTAAPAKVKRTDIGDRSWVPWVFVPVGLIGVAWLVVYYIAGDFMPGVTGGWNILVGMGCMAAAFAIATLWK